MKNTLISFLLVAVGVLLMVVLSSNNEDVVVEDIAIENVTNADEEVSENISVYNEGDLLGYYTEIERNFFGDKYICDSFVVVEGDNSLISKYISMVEKGNAVNQLDSEGNLIINLEINDQVKDVISSDLKNPIGINVAEKAELGQGAGPCHSFFENVTIKN